MKSKNAGLNESFMPEDNSKKAPPFKKRAGEILFWLALLTLAAVMLRFGYLVFVRAAYPLKYRDLVIPLAREHGFEPSLIFAIIHTESGFDPNAVSRKNAIGLMQITEDTFKWVQSRTSERESLSVEKLYEPKTNIEYGIKVLALLREEFSDTGTMLAAYNAGIGNVRRWLKDKSYSEDGISLKSIPIKETSGYVEKVPAAKRTYEKIYRKQLTGGDRHVKTE